MALLGAAALMFFGPEQLPKVARKVGLLVRDVQNTSQSFIREMERAADDTVYGSSYGGDISRGHLLEDPLAPAPAPPYEAPAYEPPHYESPPVEPPTDHPYAAKEPAVPIHDVMPPRAAGGTRGDRDLPP